YVEDAGRVGFGTATPVVELHSRDGDSPTLRLEQDNSSGFAPQTWDVAGNETNFFIRDVTNGSLLPFKIRPSAPTNSIVMESGRINFNQSSVNLDFQVEADANENAFFLDASAFAGDGAIGIGTNAPVSQLDVRAASGTPEVRIAGNNNPAFRFQDLGDNYQYTLRLATGNNNFVIRDVTAAVDRIILASTGDVTFSGNVSKAGGSFRIDHPLDPANKFLYHSFVESPDMMNVYNGNVVLDANGEAVVEMADWFEALNRDFRYQLTAIGAPGPNLYIAEEINGNRFRIAGGTPGMKVSWQVTGVRQDRWAEEHRIPVEVDKPAGVRGLYLHPQEFGQPLSRGIGYELPEVRSGTLEDRQ
ncbi:MAG: hypothetical protein R3247_07810, partial [Rhodothermales bacterium]|nr:hypothetical protein [Rhodothermales bacterium]